MIWIIHLLPEKDWIYKETGKQETPRDKFRPNKQKIGTLYTGLAGLKVNL